MLFNSLEFILLFLPIAVFGYYQLGKFSHLLAVLWLTMLSVFFYAYWSLESLPILIGSIVLNFFYGVALTRFMGLTKKVILILGIISNLLCLGYYKYVDFFIQNINSVNSTLGFNLLELKHLVLPIGISFFTFTQIAYLMDVYLGKVKNDRWLEYALFVTFFPHLIAGPIIHHRDVMPQFNNSLTSRFEYKKIMEGMVLFGVGLTKKVLIADSMAVYANNFYQQISIAPSDVFSAWMGTLAYSFQLYFDFSGYSDMALGLGLLFGIVLPINFNSPYKAASIIDFWQRWHISLTKYIGEYLYNPICLRLTRIGLGRSKYIEFFYLFVIPTIVTFAIIGLWHGPSWSYVVFGLYHGVLISLNHAWRKIVGINLPHWLNWFITFMVVNLGFVLFRSGDLDLAFKVFASLFGAGEQLFSWNHQIFMKIIGCLLAVKFLPSTALMFKQGVGAFFHEITLIRRSPPWVATIFTPFILGVLFAVCLVSLTKTTEFLYYQF